MSDKTLKQKQQRQDKEKQAYAFYVAQGWTPEQSIGIIGNIKRESGFNPNAIGDAGKAFGLAQWHPDRQAKAKSLYGNNWKSFENQLKFIDWELKNTEKVAGDKLKKTKGVWQAGQVVSDFYERPKVKFSGDETRQTYVADLAMKFKGVKLTPEDMPYFDASYANSVAPYMNQPQETITPTLNYFGIPKETTTFASVPDSAEEDKKETVEDGVTSKDVAEVETKTKEYNFLEELQKEDYSHLQPEQVAQQQIVPQVDFNQQYEQVSQFIDEPLVAQQGLTWQEKLANRPRKPTVAEIIAEGDARKAQQRIQTDNIPNTKRDLSLMLAEHNNIKKDEQELRTTGQIKNPNSIQYRRNVKTQPDIKQDDISTEQRNAQLNPLERPLIYLANPSKLLGDIGIPNMETSELDRQAISSNRFNPNQTRTQRLENQVKLGLGYVPEATVNTALAASFMPEGSGALGLVNEALNPLAGTGDLINNLGNKYLPNAYKLNPNAFKPNPEAYYRVIGEAGYKDAIENNIIRPKINSIHSINYPTFKKGVPLDNRYASSEIKGLIGDNSYIVESNGNKMVQNNWTAAAPDKDIFLPRRELKAENEGINFYKKDWLQGYKQVEVPKTTQNFNSEINWANWNKEIPDNPQLIQEYNAIEQTSKSNGSWMKNPDGSKFQGTPEQFVQQNSENFKKAFPNVLRDELGNVQKTYHGSQDTFESFDPNIMRVGRTKGEGIYTSPVKERALTYANEGDKKLYEFYQNANKKQTVLEDFNALSEKRFDKFLKENPKGSKDFDEKFKSFMNKEDVIFDKNLTDDAFKLNEGYDFYKVFPDEYVVPFTNYPKSAIGNNGMFDMNNPNIYKSTVPIAGASYLATQGQEEPKKLQQGGEFSENELAFLSEIAIKDNNGYWDKSNQGKVVEIEGGNITMKNVDQDLIGIGINKKGKKTEQKTMKAGKNYNFDKAIKVIEIPLFKK